MSKLFIEMMSTESQIALKEKLKQAKATREIKEHLKKLSKENETEIQKCFWDLVNYGVAKYKVEPNRLIRIDPLE